MTTDPLLAEMKRTPYWWDTGGAPAPGDDAPLPAAVDVAVIGGGYTGLNAALRTARAGRETLVLDAEAPGWGCSTRNGGQISTCIKPDAADLARRHGPKRARSILDEGEASLAYMGDLIAAEGIDCDFSVAGRFFGAHTPRAFEALARKAAGVPDTVVVPRAEQHREIATDAYHGGIVQLRHAQLDPARYHRGLLDRVRGAGARVVGGCGVTALMPADGGWRLTTPRGEVRARAVVVATNGYTGPATQWLRRRVIPIGSYIIATEPLPEGLMNRLLPTRRNVTDTRRVVYYYRASPDGRRMVFGGRVTHGETDLDLAARRLHAAMARVFPDLGQVRVSHAWMGFVAYSFDALPHIGVQDGLHYAMGYCGSGVGMASYLGMRLGQQVLGLPEGRTALDSLPFPTRPLYTGRPWFLPGAVAWYRLRDHLGI
ncbi:FAD-binding oxidoreductase [Rhodobacteraceae bacterium 2376]|uniref:FAD-binding oxidoreductase n=1 Tax=Rhabdonatronobacter sediminivivens TaxID=2743469 RepID=A0A7Z0KZN6_9RHOB|nr:FAD-binding oxidoreductase [Rhabdonatronobacter sediminivivens]NYS26614.1 FAD-binding oxidoreductase [Rhabdonatronobacter sediminivivens]